MSIAVFVADRGHIKRGMKGDIVHTVQLALLAAGHELVADRDFGDITEKAVKKFQASNELDPLGMVGPKTAAALDRVLASEPTTAIIKAAPSVLKVAPWLSVMRALTGTTEIPGARSNPLILGWVKEIIAKYPDLKPNLGWYVNDDTPWCGLGAAYCMADTGFKPPAAPLYALNWARAWADGRQLQGPALGAVMVFSRKGGGHVAFYEGEDATHWHIRGANQSNTINVTRRAKSLDQVKGAVRVFMWPKTGPAPVMGPVMRAASGKASTMEA